MPITSPKKNQIPTAQNVLLCIDMSQNYLPMFAFVFTVYATANPSVSPSVHHTPVLCQNEGKQRDVIFTNG